MPSLDSIGFDAAGLEPIGEEPSSCVWEAEGGGYVLLHFFDAPPDIPVPLKDVVDLTDFYRRSVASEGLGLLEISVIEIEGCPAIRLIVKAVLDEATTRGRAYLGSLTLPFRDFSFVLKVQFEETGITGIRESVVLDQLLRSGEVQPRKGRTPGAATHGVLGASDLDGWIVEANDLVPPDLARNVAEDVRYDLDFPDHPLSRVRRLLKQVEESISIDGEVIGSPGFEGGSVRRPWWRFF